MSATSILSAPSVQSSSKVFFASSSNTTTTTTTNRSMVMMPVSSTSSSTRRSSASVVTLKTRTDSNTTRQKKNATGLFVKKRGSQMQTSALPPLATNTVSSSISEISALEGNIQGFYLGTLLLILGFSGFIVVRQVFIRRELDDQAKRTGERIRAGNATSDDYFEMGSIMLRKKVYTQAIRNLQLAAENWEGDKEDLAQVHNALGFGYAEMERYEDAIKEFKLASQLQPGYVTVWNNLGDAYEKLKMQKEAVKCYEEALVLAPENSVATLRLKNMRERAERLGLTIE